MRIVEVKSQSEIKSFLHLYLNKYNNTMVELQNKLSGLSVLEKEKNNMRQMMSNVHGINSDEEIDELLERKSSVNLLGFITGVKWMKEQILNQNK